MTLPRPIEVIGGGLAGLSLGLALRRAGVPVTIFEAGSYPRHRVCGEFITGLSPDTISRLGLREFLGDALRHREVAWFIATEDRGVGPARIQRLPSPALGLSRHALDDRIATAFVAAGGELRTGVRVAMDDEAVEGRVVATGRRRSRGHAGWMGLKFHVLGLDLARDLELHLGDEAYVGLSRVEGGATNVCGLFRRRELCAKGADLLLGYLQAAGLTALAARLSAAKIEAKSFCAVAAVDFDRTVSATTDEVLRIGDASAMIPPFTGNGMAMAFQSAEAALDPLLAYARGETDWAFACRCIHRALRRRFRLRLASAHLVHPFLLQPRRQRVLASLNRTRLLPLSPLYAALH